MGIEGSLAVPVTPVAQNVLVIVRFRQRNQDVGIRLSPSAVEIVATRKASRPL